MMYERVNLNNDESSPMSINQGKCNLISQYIFFWLLMSFSSANIYPEHNICFIDWLYGMHFNFPSWRISYFFYYILCNHVTMCSLFPLWNDTYLLRPPDRDIYFLSKEYDFEQTVAGPVIIADYKKLHERTTIKLWW